MSNCGVISAFFLSPQFGNVAVIWSAVTVCREKSQLHCGRSFPLRNHHSLSLFPFHQQMGFLKNSSPKTYLLISLPYICITLQSSLDILNHLSSVSVCLLFNSRTELLCQWTLLHASVPYTYHQAHCGDNTFLSLCFICWCGFKYPLWVRDV